jgi:hypothetical protein
MILEWLQIVSLFPATRTQNVAIAFGKLRRHPADLVKIAIEMDDIVLDRNVIGNIDI